MAVPPWFEIGMWQDGFPVLSLGVARLILFFPLGTVTHTVFGCPQLRIDPWAGWTSVVLLRGDKGREEDWQFPLRMGSKDSVFVEYQGLHLSILASTLFWCFFKKKNCLDFPFWFAELSVYTSFTSMLTFLPFVIFMLAYSLAGTLSGFISAAKIVFAGIIQILNSCCSGHWHAQVYCPIFQLKQIYANSDKYFKINIPEITSIGWIVLQQRDQINL